MRFVSKQRLSIYILVHYMRVPYMRVVFVHMCVFAVHKATYTHTTVDEQRKTLKGNGNREKVLTKGAKCQ